MFKEDLISVFLVSRRIVGTQLGKSVRAALAASTPKVLDATDRTAHRGTPSQLLEGQNGGAHIVAPAPSTAPPVVVEGAAHYMRETR